MNNFLLILIFLSLLYLAIKETQFGKISKKKILNHKEEELLSVIMDRELDIEISWILLRLAEKKRDAIIDKIIQIRQEIQIEKEKTPADFEKVKKLNKESIELGFTNEKNKTGQPIYKGRVLQFNNEAEGYHGKIEQSAMQREFAKMQLKGIQRLKREGWAKDYNQFEKEELTDVVIRKPVLGEE